jgi:hypothetical protein
VIEITVDDDDDRPVTPDGPHSPERTRAVGEAISEAFRILNYATMPEKHGLAYPGDVYSVLGALSAAMSKLPQALDQMTWFIRKQVSGGKAVENARYGKHNGDTEAAYATMLHALRAATSSAGDLERWLGEGRTALNGMESTADDSEISGD